MRNFVIGKLSNLVIAKRCSGRRMMSITIT
jgi:hypothetical protein